MDIDIELPEAGQAGSSTWFRNSTRGLLSELGYDVDSSSPVNSLDIPQPIVDYALAINEEMVAPLAALSQMMDRDGLSEPVSRHLWPLCPDLLARWIGADVTLETWERRLSVVAAICSSTRGLWSLATAFIAASPFVSSPLAHLPTEHLASLDSDRLHLLLLAYYRILFADAAIAKRLDWPHGPLHILRTQHPDRGVRLLAIRVLSMQRPWSEVKRLEVEKECVGDMSQVDTEILFGHEVAEGAVKRVMVDGWLLPIHEERRLRRVEAFLDSHEGIPAVPLQPLKSSFCHAVIPIADRLFPRRSSATSTNPNFVHVDNSSIQSTLRELAPLLQQGLPCLVSSPPSSGKTHLLQYLSTLLHPGVNPSRRILSIPLADTTIDVKSLIGTYISSPTKPGTFEWMEGALAKAVRAGRWVVLDDIDRASVEMLVTVAGIARSLQLGSPGRRGRLAVPGREEIEAGEGFALFATRSTRPDTFASPVFFGHHLFSEVHLASPTDDDILSILSAKFALPAHLTSTLVRVWQDLRPLARVTGPVKAREIGLRDLEKWCARVERNLPVTNLEAGVLANPVFQDEILLEAVDTFMASLDNRAAAVERRKAMIQVVAGAIEMDEERAFALVDKRRPVLEKVPAAKQLIIGRTSTPMTPVRKQRSSRPFALTKPSLVLLERVAASLATAEPTLLVGETGTGKTTAVQYIADTCGKPLTALNLSMQTESSDLLGGFKPIDASVSARLLHAKWQKLFCETFSMAKQQNSSYLEIAAKALGGRKWQRCAELWSASARRAMEKLARQNGDPTENGTESPRKRRKPNMRAAKAAIHWQALLVEVSEFDLHHVKMNSRLVFSFVEGPLVKAMMSGEWILLDEINLASQETLEAISTILEGPSASLVLTERGDVEPITRHPDFRLFACMNPATDVGKKDLPPSLRSRFTELYVPPPDDDREALVSIITQYIGDIAAGDKAVILDIAEMYMELKRLSAAKEIVDGANTAPHYSMRTLARSLMFAIETAPIFGLRRALWEGCLMAFTMSLDLTSITRAREVCNRFLLGPMKNVKAVLSQIPSLPAAADPDDFVRFGPFWLKRGPLPPSPESRYIITPSVQAKLSDLARVIMTHRYPVLIQGPTSSGKTSAVEFLAQQTGHRFVRINNHEHTDIQEYLGTYVTDPSTGNLVFQEGLLVTAVRQGHWIVLDELNLAPTDVLEALNRLLDDNRELVIPETQEVVRPHPNFILFATQNPPGLYAGRKVLSRAFRNRFLEVHFDDVPKNELETILCQRCQIAPTYAKKIVQVFEELRHRRQASRVFESKQSFATLRDLFRWAERSAVGYQQLAEDGYMLLAERGRQEEDKLVIKGVIEDIMKVSVDSRAMYDLLAGSALARLPFPSVPESTLVWTRAMQRLFSLVASALANNEPVLLVGETGCGKTSVCDIIALAFGQQLVGVNCHQNMETADLLGSQRPVRNRVERRSKVIARLNALTPVSHVATDEDLAAIVADLRQRPDIDQAEVSQCESDLTKLSALFEWSDGPLVHAMHQGDLLLLDEVSLADDSVLERLNSVLEPGRTLVLAEKGGSDIDSATIVAHPNFHVVATMNPGGDFGKKELSPALRNRFTEIWVPPLNDRADLLQIIGLSWKHAELQSYGSLILDFFAWFGERVGDSAGLGLRDILAWVNFMNISNAPQASSASRAFNHGGQMVLIDGLESLPQCAGMSTSSVADLRRECLAQLAELGRQLDDKVVVDAPSNLVLSEDSVDIGGFGIIRGALPASEVRFHFNAPTTRLNAMRVLRACQLPKAILLEGSPGVGKTSLVSALAAVSGFKLQRINLSDQTDLIDLFGSDLPVEGGQAGEFRWRDAAFLDAMQKGDWVLLDEMNLASQTVLEGLNAVLDYRGTVYIPELGRSFARHPDFRIFAAQNPLQQGGGRKGLPKSFLNRFTKVYLQEQTAEDLLIICQSLYPMPIDIVQKMIAFNEEVRIATTVTRTLGREGSPWEFNLRDLFRWFGVLAAKNGLEASHDPVEFLRMIYLHRFRTTDDRRQIQVMFERVFGEQISYPRAMPFITPGLAQIGHSSSARAGQVNSAQLVSHDRLELAETVLKAVELGWLVILAGESGGGKRSLVEAVASQAGRRLDEFTMHPGVDTSEILGSFEQQDPLRLVRSLFAALYSVLDDLADIRADSAPFRMTLSRVQQDLASGAADWDAARVGIQSVLAQLSTGSEASDLQRIQSLMAAISTNSIGFAWVDGQLITALRTGGWYLISDANLCSPSVLDRLNSLCESNGSIVLSEKGSSSGLPEVITPHDDFRLFMTYDPRYGELSRAMRNRGIELYAESTSARHSTLSSTAINADSLLRSTAHVEHLELSGPSDIAHAVAITPWVATPTLARLAAREVGGSALVSAISWAEETSGTKEIQNGRNIQLVDPSMSSSSVTKTAATSILPRLRTYLQIEAAQTRLQAWLQANISGKSILTQSASTQFGRKSKRVLPGAGIHPLIVALRDASKLMLKHVSQPVEGIEKILLLLHHLELRCQSSAFDYSAVGLLAEWLKQELLALPDAVSLVDLVERSIQHVQTTSGLGQPQLWALFRRAFDAREISPELLDACDACADPKLRPILLEGLVTLLSSSEAAEETRFRELVSGLSDATHPDENDNSHRQIANLVELHTALSQSELTASGMSVMLSDSKVPLSDLLPLAALRNAATTGNEWLKWTTTWLDASWRNRLEGMGEVRLSLWSELIHQALDGPASYFAPIQLASARSCASGEKLPLNQLSNADSVLGSTIKSALWAAMVPQSRSTALMAVPLELLRQLLVAFDLPCARVTEPLGQAQELGRCLAEAAHEHVRKAAARHLLTCLDASRLASSSGNDIGQLYLGVSRFLIELYVTSVPMDPAVRRILREELLGSHLETLQEELKAIEQIEVYKKGISDSARRQHVISRIEAAQIEIAHLGPALARPSDPSRLAHLYNEIESFFGDTGSEKATADLISVLENDETQALHRERSYQLSTAAFVTRLRTVYIDLADLVQPIVTALLLARFGMRSIARQTEQRHYRPDAVVGMALTFPQATVNALSTLQDRSTAPAVLSGALSVAVECTNTTIRSARVDTLLGYLDQLYSTWSTARTKEQQDEQASESLYRVRKIEMDVLPDAEQEEKEFAELFPQYDADDAEASAEAPVEVEPTTSFSAKTVDLFHQLVTSFFGAAGSGAAAPLLADQLRETIRSGFDHRAFDATIDETSRVWQLDTLHRRSAELRKPTSTPNFYLGANEPEARKATGIATRLHGRLDVLIEEWPEQVVLQHIRDRCDGFLTLDVRSPVAMILTNLEQLLVHIDDWEPYANRDNSLKSYQDEMSGLIIQWRRLELSSWTRLLDDQAAQYVAADVEYTLRLYGALITTPPDAADMAKHIESLIPMITTYLQTSTLGSFASRLALLDCFRRLSGESRERDLAPIHALLSNILSNARLFAPRIDDSLRAQRAVIDKAIKDFVKLASWKDVNIFALRASAQKSHKQLHRNIRKFRDVLRQPVAPLLSDLVPVIPQAKAEQDSPASLITLDVLPPPVWGTLDLDSGYDVPAHLARLPETFSRFAALFAAQSGTNNEREAAKIDNMAVDIIETAAELAAATPATLTKENMKIVTNLAGRKRKAFSDLLKALRASGFSQSVRADASAKQQSSTWMLQRKPISSDGLPDGIAAAIASVNSYDTRLGVLLPALRAAFNGHNPDIASPDLQRGIGFTESVLATCLAERERLAGHIKSLGVYLHKIGRLADLARSNSLQGDVYERLVHSTTQYSRLRRALSEGVEAIQRHRDLQERLVTATDVEVLQQGIRELDGLIANLDTACSAASLSGYRVFSELDAALLQQADATNGALLQSLQALADGEFGYIYRPLYDVVKRIGLSAVDLPTVGLPAELCREGDSLLSSVLVIAQRLQPVDDKPDTDDPPHVPRLHVRHSSYLADLHLPDISSRLDSFIANLAAAGQDAALTSGPILLARALPFLQVLGDRYTQAISQHAYAVKSSYKLCYVVGRIMLDLAQKGFCKPQEAQDSKDDGKGDDTVDGTGMGAGTGDKNVSSEIEEEGQVEGLQGEKEEEGEKNDEDDDDDDAVDMEDDFEGELGEGKEREEEEGEEGDEEDEDHDEHAGDVDPLDPGAVDEKFWGEEESEGKDQAKDEVMEQQGQDEGGETEMTAKDEEQKADDKQKDEEKKEKDAGDQAEELAEKQQAGEEEDVELDENGEEDDDTERPDDENAPARPNEPNVNVDEGERLDLPEDINLDGEDSEQGINPEDDISLPAEDRDEDEGMDDGDDASEASQDDGAAEEDGPAATGVGEDDVAEQEEVVGQNVDLSAADDPHAQESTSQGKGQGGSTEQEQKDQAEEKDPDEEKTEAKEEDSAAPEDDTKGDGSAPQDPSSGPADNQGDGSIQSSGAPLPADTSAPPQANRSMGDILEDIRRRRDEILSQQEREQEVDDRAKGKEERPGQVEYLQDGDADEGMQALGVAGEEERQKLQDLNIVDEEDEADTAAEPGLQDEGEAEGKEESAEANRQSDRTRPQQDQPASEKALTRADINGTTEGVDASDRMDVDAPEGLDEAKVEPADVKEEISPDDIELNVIDPGSAVQSGAQGEDQWRHYASITSDLSYALCEQLRLILEPTLATRLQGDFRTGKRLNMRKIIPYIASEYTKDKIWLRRTKPSRREYQVLLSLDDSRSMAESHSVDLAYQTLALVAQALNKLEVGQVGIAKFGEAVDILHPFGDAGFTDADGAKVMKSFTFDQQKTDVAALVERTLSFLADARQKQSSTSAPDLWQLQIIISDGVCQDHHRLRTLLRRALEERVMIVFLVVDSLSQPGNTTAPTPALAGPNGKGQRPSILSMQTVEYKNVNGEMQLEMTRYLDTFPFEYYVVLRDVEALPGVLADTLRQWMARVSQSQE